MALHFKLMFSSNVKCYPNLALLVLNRIASLRRSYSSNYDSSVIDLGSLDNFTTQLMQQKSNKWERLRLKRNSIVQSEKQQLNMNNKSNLQENKLFIRYMNQNTLEAMMWNVLNSSNRANIEQAIDDCLNCKKLPSLPSLKKCFAYVSKNGDVDRVSKITALCEELIPDILHRNSNFDHYLAEAMWFKGHIVNALPLFDRVYRSNRNLRKHIQLTMRLILKDTIESTGIAILGNILKFAEGIATDLQDFYILANVWKVCFLSKWFSDQTNAFELLEKHPNLLGHLSYELPYIIAYALRNHQTDIVLRLLEVLIRRDEKELIAFTLEIMFNYRVHMKDVQGCREIIKWCDEQEISLSSNQRERFIMLLVTFDPSQVKPIIKKPPLSSKSSPYYKF